MKLATAKDIRMGKIMTCCLVAMITIALTAGCGSKGVVGKAEGMVDSMSKGDYAAVTSSFDATMTSAMSTARLGQVWSALTAQVGAFKTRTGSRTEKSQGYEIVYVTCQFEKANLDVKLVFNSSGQVSGMWFVPAQSAK